jgi:prepilin signal peptidase PulO-like enzyme (type II secretory pathway)
MRKMDEMEMEISLRAMRWAYLFTVIALFIWGIRDSICQGKITMPLFLLICQGLVYYFSSHISKVKAGDEEEKKNLKFVFLTVAFLVAFSVILLLFPGK